MWKLAQKLALVLFVLPLGFVLSGCSSGGSGGGPTPPPPISIAISPSTPQSITEGGTIGYRATVSNDSADAGVTFTATGAGCTGGACGTFTAVTATTATYNAPPMVSSTLTVTVTATSVTDTSKSASDSVTITSSTTTLTITSGPALPNAKANQAYSTTLMATGGEGALTWSLTGGLLPGGLKLSAGGVISGTPTTPNLYNFEVTVADSASPPHTAMAALNITVTTATFTIVTTHLPFAPDDVFYAVQLQSTGGVKPVTWSIISGSLPSGLTLHPATGVISGTPDVPGLNPFTVMAADSSDPQQSATQALNITVNLPTILPGTLPVGATGISYTTQLFFTGGTPPITWSIIAGMLPDGLTLNTSSGVITGTPTTADTSAFTVKAVDSRTPPISATKDLSITIAQSSANNAMLDGTYAFLAGGYSGTSGASNSAYIAGMFTADGAGNISAGAVDFNSLSFSAANDSITGTYSLNSDNRGSITITGGALGTFTFAMAANHPASTVTAGALAEFDANPFALSGHFYLQTGGPFSNSSFHGAFAFGLDGSAAGGGAAYSAAGALTADGAGTIRSGAEDTNTAGTPAANLAITGTYSVAANGRGTASAITSAGTSEFAFYLVNSSFALLAGSDSASAGAFSSGTATLQTGAPFTGASLSATAVFYTAAVDASVTGADMSVGLFVPDGEGGYVVTLDENDGGNLIPPTPTAGTYSVDSAGRVTLTGFTNSPVFYLSGANQGYIVGTDLGSQSGALIQQQAGPYSAASFDGTYYGAGVLSQLPGASLYSGLQTADGVSATTIVEDMNTAGLLQPGVAVNRAYTISASGRGVETSGAPTFTIYMISPSRYVVLSSNPSDTNSVLGIFDPE